MNYALEADVEVLRLLISLKKRDCNHIVGFFDHLQAEPFSEGQAVLRDNTGREIQLSKTDKFLIYHWTDHAVKTVRVVRIEIKS